jgi:hypothetical protein
MNSSRRFILFAGAGAGVLAASAIAYESWRLLARHYPPTPYDDLLSLLPDREAARRLGGAFLSGHTNFKARYAANALRKHIAGRPLPNVLDDEIAAGALTEAGHWLVPDTLAGLCALAATV